MKKTSVAMLVFVAVVVFVLSAPFCWARDGKHDVPVNLFTGPEYNFGFNLPMGEASLLGFTWHIYCFEGIETIPSDGKREMQICTGGNQRFKTILLWRDPSISPAEIERMVFGFMAGTSREPGKILCNEEVFPSDVDEKGILRDCVVPINFPRERGEFYVSFYHFSSKLPNYKTFVGSDGKEKDTLEFTIWIRNSGTNSTREVREKIRELVSSIQVLNTATSPEGKDRKESKTMPSRTSSNQTEVSGGLP